MKIIAPLAMSAVLATFDPAGAQVYKSVDANGNVTFSNAPTETNYELQWQGASGATATFGGAPPPPAQGEAQAEEQGGWSGDSPAIGTNDGGVDTEVSVYEYDDPGRLTGVTRDGVRTTNEYDARNNLVRKQRSDGAVTTYDVSPNNQVRRMTVTGGRR